jgi:hypothetical protein
VGDVVGVPAFGEHADGDDATNLLAGLAGAADGSDDAAELFGGGLAGGVGVFGFGLGEELGVDAEGAAEVRVFSKYSGKTRPWP